MTSRLIIIFMLLFFSSFTAFAQDLKGTMTDEGNGIYTLDVRGPNGARLSGEAEDYGDGKLHAVMEDQCDEIYTGTVNPLGGSVYGLHVENERTDVESYGIVTMNDSSRWFLRH